MKRTALYVTSFCLLFAGSIAALGLGAAVDTPRTLMAPGDYAMAKRAIEAETRAALGRCRDVPTGARDVCKAEARAAERVKRAELVARYHGTVSAAGEVQLAKVKAVYDVARVRCNARLADERVNCLKEAREVRDRSLAQAAPSAT